MGYLQKYKNSESERMSKRIIRFGDKVGLSNEFASTAYSGITTSYIDNYIENRVLDNILKDRKFNLALDVDCGHGRFFNTLLNHATYVTGIEPAKKIYHYTKELYSNYNRINLYHKSLEELPKNKKYDLFLVSGIMYFYNVKKKNEFICEIKSRAKPNHTVVIRDFVCGNKEIITKSKFVEGEWLYYHNTQFWCDFAKSNDYSLKTLCLSKALCKILRISLVNKIINTNMVYNIFRKLKIETVIYKQYDPNIPVDDNIYSVFIELVSNE